MTGKPGPAVARWSGWLPQGQCLDWGDEWRLQPQAPAAPLRAPAWLHKPEQIFFWNANFSRQKSGTERTSIFLGPNAESFWIA